MKNSIQTNCVNFKEEDKYNAGIYKIFHETCPTRLYVGSTVKRTRFSGFVPRWCRHYNDLLKNNHCNKKLQRVVNKYGIAGLRFEILEAVSDNTQIIMKEQYWIDFLKPYYNICKKAGSSLGRKTSLKNIVKMSRSVEQYALNGAFLERFLNAADASRKTGINIACIRQSCNRQVLNKTSQAGGFQWKFIDSPVLMTNYAKETSCKVACYTKEGNYFKTFSSIREASLELNIPTGNISKHINDERSGYCYDYIFRKASDNITATIKTKDHHKNQFKVLITDLITKDSSEYPSFNKVGRNVISKCTLSKLVKLKQFETIHKNRYKIHIMPYE